MPDDIDWGDGCACCTPGWDDWPSPALDFIMGEALEEILYPRYLTAEECSDLAVPILRAMQHFGIQVEYPGF